MSYQDTLVNVIDTSLIKKPDSPQFRFTNPLTKKIFVNSIQLSFDAYFSEKGSVIIKINNSVILFKKAGSFKRLKNFTVPLKNQEFLQQQKIEIYAWNGSGDSDLVSVGYDIKISEDPDVAVSNDTPLSQLQRNSEISEAEIVFPIDVYTDETLTKLLNMKGYKKLIINMSASSIPPITEHTGYLTGNQGNLNGSGQANFSESDGSADYALTQPNDTDDYDNFQIIDLGDTRDRSLTYDEDKNATSPVVTLQAGWQDAGTQGDNDGFIDCDLFINQLKTETYDVLESDDVTFATFTTLETGVASITEPLLTTKRYLKIIEHVSVSFVLVITRLNFQNNIGFNQGLPNHDIEDNYNKVGTDFTNWVDSISTGGNAKLSFEELDISPNLFTELISSTEFGTITEGDAVKKQIGDVNNVSTSGKTYFLPSTQNGLRMKLVVVKAIETSVSIRRIA